MAAHVSASSEPIYPANYLVATDGNQKERSKQRRDYIDKIDTDYIMQKRSRFGLNEGLQWKPDFFPKKVIFAEGDRAFGYNGYTNCGTIVDQVFKDCHDRIHTVGGNQFFPVEILNKDKSRYPGQFYFFVPTTVRDAINNVMDGGYFNYIGDDYKSFHIKSMGNYKLAVFKDRIEGCAVWVDPAYSAREKRTFFSDAFLSELKNHGVEGFHCATTWQEL
jgi:hypothetical protein